MKNICSLAVKKIFLNNMQLLQKKNVILHTYLQQ